MAVWTAQIVLIFPHQILATVMCGCESDFFETRPQFEQTSDPCRTWTSGSPFLRMVCREFQTKTHVMVQRSRCHPESLDNTYFAEVFFHDFTSAHSAGAVAPQRASPAILTLLLFIFLLPIISNRRSPASTAHSLENEIAHAHICGLHVLVRCLRWVMCVTPRCSSFSVPARVTFLKDRVSRCVKSWWEWRTEPSAGDYSASVVCERLGAETVPSFNKAGRGNMSVLLIAAQSEG